tara:strand:- start:18499 stop:19797 length:1299 start_codon:yes stop_codon:yes gene_type:complete
MSSQIDIDAILEKTLNELDDDVKKYDNNVISQELQSIQNQIDENSENLNMIITETTNNEESKLESLEPKTVMQEKHSKILEKIFEIIINNINYLLNYLDHAKIDNDGFIYGIVSTMGLVYAQQKGTISSYVALIFGALVIFLKQLHTELNNLKTELQKPEEMTIQKFNELLANIVDRILDIDGLPRIIHLAVTIITVEGLKSRQTKVIKDLLNDEYNTLIKKISFVLFQNIDENGQLIGPEKHPIFHNLKYFYEQNTKTSFIDYSLYFATKTKKIVTNTVDAVGKTINDIGKFCRSFFFNTVQESCPTIESIKQEVKTYDKIESPISGKDEDVNKYIENVKELMQEIPTLIHNVQLELVYILSMSGGVLQDENRLKRLIGFIITLIETTVDIVNNKTINGGKKNTRRRKKHKKSRKSRKSRKYRRSRKSRKH